MQTLDDMWHVMDRPTYGLVTHSMQRWEGAKGLHQGWEGTPLLPMKRGAIDTRMARTGRAHVDMDEDLLKQGKRVGDPGRWDALCDMWWTCTYETAIADVLYLRRENDVRDSGRRTRMA